MKPQTTPAIGDHMQAALALGKEARKRAQEDFLPAPDPITEDDRHLLIEGTMRGHFLDVTMPTGEVWHYQPGQVFPEGKTLLLHIDLQAPLVARTFRPTAEGIHPCLGDSFRFGVERKVA